MPPCPTLLVTGGIATGKSTFCRMLQNNRPEIAFFDSDACVHELLTRREVVEQIAASLGKDLQATDGSLDRTRTSALVFRDPGSRRVLEEILHPMVCQACLQAQHQAETNPGIPFFVADVPLFYETGFPLVTALQIVIACGPQTQRQRLLARSPHHDPHYIDSRLAAQLPILEKVLLSHSVLWNGGELSSLSQQTHLFLSWLNQKFLPPLSSSRKPPNR